jgi:hypothetical protein
MFDILDKLEGNTFDESASISVGPVHEGNLLFRENPEEEFQELY